MPNLGLRFGKMHINPFIINEIPTEPKMGLLFITNSVSLTSCLSTS